jgi:hypothetical protein
MLRVVATFAVLILGGVIQRAQAVPMYSASAVGCGAQSVNNSLSAVTVGTPQTDCNSPNQFGYGSAFAQSSSGGLGASADWTTICCGTATSGGGTASVLTEFMITGPAGPVPIRLNLELTGAIGGGVPPGTSERRIDMTVIIGGTNVYRGWVDELVQQGVVEVTKGPDLVLPGTNCSSPCNVSTYETLVMANTPIAFEMRLSAWVSGFAGGGGYAHALNTLYFPKDGPVFDLPDGYSAVIYGLNVEGNRVIGQPNGGGGEVPEPGTYGLVGAALALAALRRATISRR